MGYSRKKQELRGGGAVGTHQFYIPYNDLFHAETPTVIYPNEWYLELE